MLCIMLRKFVDKMGMDRISGLFVAKDLTSGMRRYIRPDIWYAFGYKNNKVVSLVGYEIQ